MAIDSASTAFQNLVTATNANTQAINQGAGQYTSQTYSLSAQTQQGVVVITGSSRLVHVCVVQSGAGTVKFYNSQTANDLPDSNLLYVLPANTPQGIIQVNMMFSNGIVMIIGNDVQVNCTYSTLRA
jgi:hypothetical protein